MKQIKVVTSDSASGLEKQVNERIAEMNAKGYRAGKITYKRSRKGFFNFSAMIVFKPKRKESISISLGPG